MRSLLISDNKDTQLGLRLAGIDGVVLHEREEILRELNKAICDKDIGIIIITEKVMEKVRDEVTEIKLKHSIPLIIVIPDRHGFKEKGNYITKYIREVLGIKI